MWNRRRSWGVVRVFFQSFVPVNHLSSAVKVRECPTKRSNAWRRTTREISTMRQRPWYRLIAETSPWHRAASASAPTAKLIHSTSAASSCQECEFAIWGCRSFIGCANAPLYLALFQLLCWLRSSKTRLARRLGLWIWPFSSFRPFCRVLILSLCLSVYLSITIAILWFCSSTWKFGVDKNEVTLKNNQNCFRSISIGNELERMMLLLLLSKVSTFTLFNPI